MILVSEMVTWWQVYIIAAWSVSSHFRAMRFFSLLFLLVFVPEIFATCSLMFSTFLSWYVFFYCVVRIWLHFYRKPRIIRRGRFIGTLRSRAWDFYYRLARWGGEMGAQIYIIARWEKKPQRSLRVGTAENSGQRAARWQHGGFMSITFFFLSNWIITFHGRGASAMKELGPPPHWNRQFYLAFCAFQIHCAPRSTLSTWSLRT